MSNWMFMQLFPDAESIISSVVEETKKREGVVGSPDGIFRHRRGIGEFNALQAQYPQRVNETLGELVQGYNGYVDAMMGQFPLTTDAFWQIYRRNLCKASLPMDIDPNKTDAQNDAVFSDFYLRVVKRISDEDVENPVRLDEEPQLELLERKPEFLGGIGLYTFRRSTELEPVTTIWDLRQREVPRLTISR